LAREYPATPRKEITIRHAGQGMFGGIAHLFGRDTGGDTAIVASADVHTFHARRRPDCGGRRSDVGSEAASDVSSEGDDRWGYSSGEEDEPSDGEDIARDKSSVYK